MWRGKRKQSKEYTSCWCDKCRGGDVTKRTQHNHEAKPRFRNAPEGEVARNTAYLSQKAQSSKKVGNRISSPLEDNEEDELGLSQETKRRRIAKLQVSPLE